MPVWKPSFLEIPSHVEEAVPTTKKYRTLNAVVDIYMCNIWPLSAPFILLLTVTVGS